MVRFRVALWSEGDVVKMKVLAMDDALRVTGLLSPDGYEGVKVRSVSSPELTSSDVYLRGRMAAYDNRVAEFVTDNHADYIARATAGIIAAGGEVVGRPDDVVTADEPTGTATAYRVQIAPDDGRSTCSIELKLTPTQYGDLVRYIADLI